MQGTTNGGRRRMALGAALVAAGLALAVALRGTDEDSGGPSGLEREAPSADGRGEADAAGLPPSVESSDGERVPGASRVEGASPEAPEPVAAPAPTAPSRRLLFCDGVPATNLEFRLPGQYSRSKDTHSTGATGLATAWPEGETTPWLRISDAVLGSTSGQGAPTTAGPGPGTLTLGLRRVLVAVRVPAGLGSRRVKLSASMPALGSDDFHRSVTSIDPTTGPAAFFTPCDRAFRIEASIGRADRESPDYFGTLHVPASTRSDAPLTLDLLPTYRGTLRVVDPSETLGETPFTLTAIEPHGRFRQKGLLVGESYDVPPGEYAVRVDVDALATRDTDQLLAETRVVCDVASGLETVVPLELEPGSRIRVRAEPGSYLLRGSGDVVDLERGRGFQVELYREGKSRIPSHWFGVEAGQVTRCEVGYGPYDSSAIRPGVVHVKFRVGKDTIGEPVAVSVGPGEAVEVVMPAQ